MEYFVSVQKSKEIECIEYICEFHVKSAFDHGASYSADPVSNVENTPSVTLLLRLTKKMIHNRRRKEKIEDNT